MEDKAQNAERRIFIQIPVTAEERDIAKKLAKAKHTDMAKMVRDMIRRSAAQHGI